MALAASEVLASYREKELELILDFLVRMRDVGLTQTRASRRCPSGPSDAEK